MIFLALFEGGARIKTAPGCNHTDALLQYAQTHPAQNLSASMRASVPMPSDPLLGWINLPGFEGINLGTHVQHNSLGLRGPEIPIKKPAGLRRIAVLGDSSIYGHGVEGQFIFASLLQEWLKRYVPQGAVEVINAGVPAYSSLQSLRQLNYVIGQMSPDILIIANMWSDSMPTEQEDYTWLVGDGLKGQLYEQSHRWDAQLSQVSAGWCMVKAHTTPDFDDGTLFRHISQPSATPREELPTRRVPPEAYAANLTAMVTWARQHQAAPVLVALGHPSDRSTGMVRIGQAHQANIQAYRQQMRDVASAQKVAYADTSVGFAAARDAGNNALFVDSIHPSIDGHQIIAESILSTLLANPETRRMLGLSP